MSVLYLEPVGGIAGDMFLACCIDLGVEPKQIEEAVKVLDLPAWRLEVRRTERHSIAGTHVQVCLEAADSRERTWSFIRGLLEGSSLAEGVKARALETFAALARAEAHVHGVGVEEVHFHEVGAVDSIVDIVGAAVCLELLGSPRVFAAPPPLGSGLVRSRHGMVPIPGPATIELLKDRPVRFEGVGELTTPTGAALLAALTTAGDPGEFVPQRIGMGMGSREMPDRPNLLRATLGSQGERRGSGETLQVLEANLDDMNPQLFGPLMADALALGALDVWVAPILMKKGRPGHLLGILVRPELVAEVRRLVFRQSTTLGVRSHPVERQALDRRVALAQTPWGVVRIKVGLLDGSPVTASPEFEDCRRIAAEAGVAVKEVIAAALAAHEAARPGGRAGSTD